MAAASYGTLQADGNAFLQAGDTYSFVQTNNFYSIGNDPDALERLNERLTSLERWREESLRTQSCPGTTPSTAQPKDHEDEDVRMAGSDSTSRPEPDANLNKVDSRELASWRTDAAARSHMSILSRNTSYRGWGFQDRSSCVNYNTFLGLNLP